MAALADQNWSWFEEEVNRHYLQFTEKKNVNLMLGTWNVNAKEPSDSISSWLFGPDDSKFDADMYVLGFQEIVDLNAANLWIENDANKGWENMTEACLGKHTRTKKYEFVKVASRHLVGILLLVYCKKELSLHISNVMSSVCGVGLFGTAGNKGGVAVRMTLYDSDVCFVSAHLAAHKNNVQGRNQDYLKIIENLKFYENDDEQNNANADTDNSQKYLSIIQNHDMIFWLGDLNYRLNFEDLADVFRIIGEKNWAGLLARDQLNEERGKEHSFIGFKEKEITFRPTYKYQPGTDEFEQRPDKKKRFPAWCDRILWRNGLKKTSDISDAKCLIYTSSMDQKMSDHKPVYALMSYGANVFDHLKKKEMKRQIMKNKDKKDNNKLPQIEIEPEVSFPLIKFGEVSVQQFIIENTGQVVVSYRFTHAEHKAALPEWLRIHPPQGLVRPGGHKAHISFEICITHDCIPSKCKLEETVLLRIENTSDKVVPMKFVTVTAKYLPSCFGNRIESLVKCRKPIRYISSFAGDADSVVIDDEYSVLNETTLSIPKELWRLIDFLYKYGMDCESIFIQRGISSEISEIRECLDTGKAFSRYELHSVGEALVRFLESLQDPVFSASLCDSFKDNMDVTQWCRQALMRLPISHYNTFIYTISFLREVLKHSSRNRLTPEKLAYQFSSALMQTKIKDVNTLAHFKPFKILRHFLSSDLFL